MLQLSKEDELSYRNEVFMKKEIIKRIMDVVLFFVIVFALLNVSMYFGLIKKEPALPTALAVTAAWSLWKVIKYFLDRRIERMESEDE